MPFSPADADGAAARADGTATADDTARSADAAFRLEVGRLRARDQRRRFPTELRLGCPARQRVALEAPVADPGLRFDLVTALIDLWRAEHGGGAGYAWLVRSGQPTVHDDDLAWYAAAVHAFGAHGARLHGFRTVTRTGWLDVVTGESRVWKRLRLARAP